MCVTFGDPSAFAVRVQLAEHYHGKWLFGHLCYLISGKVVGNFDTVTSLRDVLGQMNYIIKDSGKRENLELFGCSPQDVFYALDSSLYEGCEKGEGAKSISLPENFAVYEGKLSVESFDEWKVFVIDSVQETKILYRRESKTKIGVAVIKYARFDEALLQLYDHIGDLLQIEETSA